MDQKFATMSSLNIKSNDLTSRNKLRSLLPITNGEKLFNKTIYTNINTFLTQVDINSKENWKENTEQVFKEAPKKVTFASKPHKLTLFEAIKENHYSKRGLDFRKNFCHKLTTNPVTLYFNEKKEEKKYGFRSASVSYFVLIL